MAGSGPTIADRWRAMVGRLPRFWEERLYFLAGKYGSARVEEAIAVVVKAGHRRTRARVLLLHAYLGEECPAEPDEE